MLVDVVDAPLGVAAYFVPTALRALLGRIECDDPGVVVVGALHGASSQTEHDTHNTGFGIDVLVPDIWVRREAHAGDLGVEDAAELGSTHSLNEQCHLLVVVQNATLGAIAYGIFAHGAGVDYTHGIEKLVEPLTMSALICAEHTVVLAREGIAEVVLQQ